jgi:hypothetical protein
MRSKQSIFKKHTKNLNPKPFNIMLYKKENNVGRVKMETKNLNYKPETVEKYKEIYNSRKDTIEYMIKFGNVYDQAIGLMFKTVAEAAQTA